MRRGAGKGVGVRALQARNTVRRAVAHPRWFLETLRLNRDRRREARRPFSLEPYRAHIVSGADAITAVSGASRERYEAAVRELWRPPGYATAPRAVYDPRDELVTMVGALVRLVAPSVMVEIGVAQGVTTAVTLAAMERNGAGELYSIDLPRLAEREREFVGRAVPEELRERWTLLLGPSRQVLPELVDRLPPVDLFLHDADHTYASQLEEYRTAWPHLRRGGVLVSDDVGNPAFIEFAAEAGERPYLVRTGRHATAVGLLRKG